MYILCKIYACIVISITFFLSHIVQVHVLLLASVIVAWGLTVSGRARLTVTVTVVVISLETVVMISMKYAAQHPYHVSMYVLRTYSDMKVSIFCMMYFNFSFVQQIFFLLIEVCMMDARIFLDSVICYN